MFKAAEAVSWETHLRRATATSDGVNFNVNELSLTILLKKPKCPVSGAWNAFT